METCLVPHRAREKKINNWKIGEKSLRAQCEPPLKNYRLTISGNRHRSYVQWTGCVVCTVCALLSRVAWWTFQISPGFCALRLLYGCTTIVSFFAEQKKTIFIARSTGSIHIIQCWCIPSVYLNLYGNYSLALSCARVYPYSDALNTLSP